MKNLIKLSIALILFSAMLGASFKTEAYPPYLRQALKFGAKNCLFCHTQPSGGEGWNERGQWLIDEKERRKADDIDIEWLAEYKEGAKKGTEKKDVEKTAAEKSDAEKTAAEKSNVEKTAAEKSDAEKSDGDKKDAEKKNADESHKDGEHPDADKHEDGPKDGDKAEPKEETKKVKKAPKVIRKKPVTNNYSAE
ncbi:MAG TPA: hypothetical protein VJ302_11625 [Blastocatellia bacterium]|nr:hypothetical protein [Blastocatellia bacterium]